MLRANKSSNSLLRLDSVWKTSSFKSENQIASVVCDRSLNSDLYKRNVDKYSMFSK